MDQDISLTENGLTILDQINLNEDKKKVVNNLDIILQILIIAKDIKQNGVRTITMADYHFKYTGFLLKYENGAPEVGDILRIKTIAIAIVNNKTKIYYIKDFEVLQQAAAFQFDPSSLENYRKHSQQMNNNNNHTNNYNYNNNNHMNHNDNNHTNHNKNNIHNNMEIDEESYNINNINNKSNNNKSNFDDSNCSLLSTLTTFTKNLHIYVKCVKKTEMKNYNSRNGTPGCLINFFLRDKEGFEIPSTAFNDGAKKLDEKIFENHCYEIKGGYIKINEKRFSLVKSDYKIIFDEHTEVNEVNDNGAFSEIQLNFTNIVDIPNLSPDSIIDILGYVIEIGEMRQITTKRGETYIRRIEIGDSSGFKVELTLWGKFAENSVELKKIYAFQNVKTNEFNGSKRIGTIESTRIIEQLNNYQNEIDILYNYINENNGEFKEIVSDKSITSTTYTNSDFHLLNEIESDDNLIDKTLRVKAYVTNINHTDKNFYPGCPSCKKKVTQDNENWFCQNCNKHLDSPKYYYTISCRIRDYTSEIWIELFGDTAEKFIGVPIDDYKEYVFNNDVDKLNMVNNKLELKQFNFIGKIRVVNYQNVTKKRLSIYRFEEIHLKKESEAYVKYFESILF